jgi:hypothetical protein
MMSCTASVAWSCLVLSLCCTEPGPSRGAVLSGHITTVFMSRSGELGLCCTVELNCSDLSARLAGASVTRDRALDTCEPSCVPGAASPFFIPVVHNLLGAVGYMAATELSSRGGEVEATWQRWSLPRQGAEEHMAAPELSSRGGRARSHVTRDSVGAHLGREVRSGAEERVTASELNSASR